MHVFAVGHCNQYFNLFHDLGERSFPKWRPKPLSQTGPLTWSNPTRLLSWASATLPLYRCRHCARSLTDASMWDQLIIRYLACGWRHEDGVTSKSEALPPKRRFTFVDRVELSWAWNGGLNQIRGLQRSPLPWRLGFLTSLPPSLPSSSTSYQILSCPLALGFSPTTNCSGESLLGLAVQKAAP